MFNVKYSTCIKVHNSSNKHGAVEPQVNNSVLVIVFLYPFYSWMFDLNIGF